MKRQSLRSSLRLLGILGFVFLGSATALTGWLSQPASASPPSPPACTITGTGTNGTIMGTPSADVICGTQADETINGNGGADVIYPGAGNDIVVEPTGITAPPNTVNAKVDYEYCPVVSGGTTLNVCPNSITLNLTAGTVNGAR